MGGADPAVGVGALGGAPPVGGGGGWRRSHRDHVWDMVMPTEKTKIREPATKEENVFAIALETANDLDTDRASARETETVAARIRAGAFDNAGELVTVAPDAWDADRETVLRIVTVDARTVCGARKITVVAASETAFGAATAREVAAVAAMDGANTCPDKIGAALRIPAPSIG